MRSANRNIPGTCCVCRKEVADSRIRRHLPRCIEAHTGLRPARNPRRRDRRRIAEKTAHISVRSRERPHWLELEVRCDVTLYELDAFLRSVWLECCGHLSNFRINGETYSIVVCPASTRFAELPSISFAGSPPRPQQSRRVAGLHQSGSWGRRIPG